MIEDVYALSPLQEGMYYHWLKSPRSTAYCEQFACTVEGELDINKLKASYEQLVSRYAVLRTFFTNKYGEGLLQVVKKHASATFSFIDRPSLTIEEFKKSDREKGFDL